jgi:hypothetical protein
VRRRIIRIALWCFAVLIVIGLTAAVVALFRFRALGSERSTPVARRTFITPDASCVLLVKWDLADEGVGDFSAPLIAAYDETREKAAGFWERRAYFLFGFDRPSDVITRPLPAEGAFILRYDEMQSRFHSHAAVSVSGLASLMKEGASRLPSLLPNPGVALEERSYQGETLFVAQNGSGPPAARLDPRDFGAVFAPLTPPGGCWSVVDNNLLLARRPDSLTFLVDQLKSNDAPADPPIASLLPEASGGIDATGVLLNKHGEFAGLIEFAARTMQSRLLDRWLKSKRAKARDDLAAVSQITVAVDVQPGDRIAATFGIKFSDLERLMRVLVVLDAAFKEIKPPPPIAFQAAEPNVTLDGVELRVTVTGVREYFRRRIAGGSP